MERKETVNTNFKWQKFKQMQIMCHVRVRAVTVILKLPHKLLHHPLGLQIQPPTASYGYGGETQNYICKQYPNELYRPRLQ